MPSKSYTPIRIEQAPLSLVGFAISFLIAHLWHTFLTAFRVPHFELLKAPFLFDQQLFSHLAFVLALALWLHLLIRERIERTSRGALAIFWLMLIAVGGGALLSKASVTTQSTALAPADLLLLWIRPDPTTMQSLGGPSWLAIEGVVAGLAAAFYIQAKIKQVGKAILGGLGTYVLFFLVLFSLPGLLTLKVHFLARIVGHTWGTMDVSALHQTIWASGGLLGATHKKVSIAYLLLLVVLSLVWFLCFDRRKAKAFMGNIRPYRCAHYMGMALFGLALGYSLLGDRFSDPFGNPSDVLAVLAIALSALFSWQSAIAFNDIYDVKSDALSNTNRPLVTAQLSPRESAFLGCIFLLFAVYFAINVNYSAFVIAVVYNAMFLMYSAPPLRLKRFFPLSTFIVALGAVLALYLGFSLFAGLKTTLLFPNRMVILMLTVFTLSFNTKDVKDIAGDQLDGTVTLMTLLGAKRGKMVIAALVFIAYSITALLIGVRWVFIPGVLAGIANFFIITAKNYHEERVFWVYFAFGAIMFYAILTHLPNIAPEFF